MRLKQGFVAAVLLAASLPAVAKDITVQGLSQDDFHKISQDLGAALSYKPLTPAEPLGLFGFDFWSSRAAASACASSDSASSSWSAANAFTPPGAFPAACRLP